MKIAVFGAGATGGHFAAMEEPDLFVADVRAWGASV